MGLLADAFRQREMELQWRVIAKWVAKEVVAMIGERGSVSATDVVSRRGEEKNEWRDDGKKESECLGLIQSEGSGESSMSDEEARGLLRSLRRKGKGSGRPRR